MDLVNVICEGTMQAFARIAVKPGVKIDAARATAIMKTVVIERYDSVVAELKETLDANVGEHWLRQAVNGCGVIPLSLDMGI
jgi:hypothetical protein